MAEILVRVVDKQESFSVKQSELISTAGDVIVVAPDGWSWGSEELANPEWRIWRLQGIDPRTLEVMTEIDVNKIGGLAYTIRKRVRYLDLSSAEARKLIARGPFVPLTAEETLTVLSWRCVKRAPGTVG